MRRLGFMSVAGSLVALMTLPLAHAQQMPCANVPAGVVNGAAAPGLAMSAVVSTAPAGLASGGGVNLLAGNVVCMLRPGIFKDCNNNGIDDATEPDSAFADLDGDGDVDGTDFLTFSNCFNGALNPPLPACANLCADIDMDGDVDGTDFLTFSNCFNGALNPPLCP